MIDFLDNIGTVLSLRRQNVSRRLVGERLLEAFEPTRRMIALTEAKWCAVDLLTSGFRGCSSACTCGAFVSTPAPGRRCCWAAC
ncbi:MAG TPA: hypothetical protein VKV24_03440 [Casimicrobiaceae bacterium]|nr:hypothetical protein [Casimicrobiaceae bacterium]